MNVGVNEKLGSRRMALLLAVVVVLDTGVIENVLLNENDDAGAWLDFLRRWEKRSRRTRILYQE